MTGSAPQPLHLVYLTDSSGWQAAEAYQASAQRALGIPVTLVDLRYGALTMVDALARVQENREAIAHAEIVVLWASPVGSGVTNDNTSCVQPSSQPPVPLSVADWEPFTEATGRVLDAVWEARARRPTVVRLTDLYAPVGRQWRDAGMWDTCMANFDTMSRALRAAAGSHGATFVSALDAYNGADRSIDPVAAGLISEDGIHPSEAGGRAMAAALAATGFVPTQAPEGR